MHVSRVRSLGSLSGLRIQCCCGRGVGQQLQLQFNPLAWEFPYVAPVGPPPKKNPSKFPYLKFHILGNSLVYQLLGLSAFTATAQVQSLVWELRSHIKLMLIVAKK